jgi:hypothetical protein
LCEGMSTFNACPIIFWNLLTLYNGTIPTPLEIAYFLGQTPSI